MSKPTQPNTIKALKMIRAGTPTRKAAEICGIDRRTLHRNKEYREFKKLPPLPTKS